MRAWRERRLGTYCKCHNHKKQVMLSEYPTKTSDHVREIRKDLPKTLQVKLKSGRHMELKSVKGKERDLQGKGMGCAKSQ